MTTQPTFETPRALLEPAARGDLDALWTIWRDPGPHYRIRTYLLERAAG